MPALIKHSMQYIYWPSYSPVDTSQSITPSTSLTDTLQSTSTQDPVLLIRHSRLLPQYQFYWYSTVHLCPSTRPVLLLSYSPLLPQHQSYWYTTVHYCPSTSSIDTTYSTTTQLRVLITPYSPLLSNYQSYWYDAVHYCPSTSPSNMLSPFLPQ